MKRASVRLLLLGAALANTGCIGINSVQTVEKVELEVAETDVPESRLLDVGIVEFAAGIPEDNNPDKSGVYPEIRKAEARYFPYHLKTTLQKTGSWGAVRVLPSENVYTDLYVSGEILRSNGDRAAVEIEVVDATGREWFSETYKTDTDESSYSQSRDLTNDPYQNIYNEIANDLDEKLAELSDREIRQIRTVAELRFMEYLSPNAFSGYLEEDRRGNYEIVRLPAKNDPMVERLRKVRNRDHLFIDTLNEHYANFYYGIAIPYEGWRRAAREEAINIRQLRKSALLRGLAGVVMIAGAVAADDHVDTRTDRILRDFVIYGGYEAIFSGIGRLTEANLHEEAIRELAVSFTNEAAPMVVNVQGETRRLTGTAEAQYDQWRRLLREIYEQETGLSGEVQVGQPSRAPPPAS